MGLCDNFAYTFAESACGIGFIGVEMSCGSKLLAHADNHIAEGQAARFGVDLQRNNLLILQTKLLRVGGVR